MLIGLLILFGSGRVLKESVHVLAEGVPRGMTATGIVNALRRLPGVIDVHDLHVWTVAPGYIALSAHVVVGDQALSRTGEIMAALKESLEKVSQISGIPRSNSNAGTAARGRPASHAALRMASLSFLNKGSNTVIEKVNLK
ncbi:MAG: hypothetical protein MZV63_65670 [Marinilabiliales bacterium]|nr:hypothetical protein [Marinilabiliales bacterium]